jgi:hypothetical protein
MTRLTRHELRLIYVYLDGRRGAEVDAVREKLRRMIAERAGELTWGRKVYEIMLPLSTPRLVTKGKHAGEYVRDPMCPTLNVYGSMEVWKRSALYKAIDIRILAELHKWPRARQVTGKRGVRVTRHSSVTVDEITVDVIGGKVPIDRLVKAGILAGDSAAEIEREAVWVQASPKHGFLTAEVFELVGSVFVAPP